MSVIAPVYNVLPYLHEALDSVVNQTYRNLEIIVIDDGSTDGSGDVCDEYAEQDSRVRVIHQRNQGLSAARNVGIDAATSDYLLFLDSDDWMDQNAVEVLLREAKLADADITCCQTTVKKSSHPTKPRAAASHTPYNGKKIPSCTVGLSLTYINPLSCHSACSSHDIATYLGRTLPD